jgi:nucleotide-binding universal stress UspA family protein
MIKDILVHLDCQPPSKIASNYALALAKSFGAYASCIAIAHEPAALGTVFGSVAVNLLDAAREENLRVAKEATVGFEEAARGTPVDFSSQVALATMGDAGRQVAIIARYFDLSVIRQEREGDFRRQTDIIEGLMFGSGRPVIVVPYIYTTPPTFDRVMICWDCSHHAARAAADAMPILAQAKSIEVVTVAAKETETQDLPGTAIAEHLARHKLDVKLKNLVAGDIQICDALLSYAADSSADLLVMGAYGHSRVREFALGGVTHNILQTMTVPVLFSH